MKRVNAFIQARMGSSRLPGKVLKNLNGKPVIIHLVQRLRQAKCFHKIVLLTSTNSENDELCAIAQREGILIYRGPEDNVLKRFQLAAELFPCDYIMRLTGDSPFVEPSICEQLYLELLSKNADYAYLSEHYAEGVDCEVFKTAILTPLDTLSLRPSELEHVTLHFYENNHGKYNVVEMQSNSDDSHYRFTLDTPEDWQVVKAISLAEKGSIRLTYAEIKLFLDSHPEVKKINSRIIRNEGLAISLYNEQQIVSE